MCDEKPILRGGESVGINTLKKIIEYKLKSKIGNRNVIASNSKPYGRKLSS